MVWKILNLMVTENIISIKNMESMESIAIHMEKKKVKKLNIFSNIV